MYTYDDFTKKAQASGLYGQFSESDLRLAQQNPDAGMSLLQYKQDYAGAKTPEQKAYYNSLAEQTRTKYGSYTGGTDGSGFNYNGSAFQQQELPEYQESKQGAQARTLSDQLVNRPAFSYSKNQDPSYSAYAKQYRREGQRATADALGQAAAATGGIPSTYAVGAASQAGDYYASKLADKLPELFQQAYQRYLDEYTLKNSTIATLNGMEQQNYDRYRDTVGDVKDQNNFNYGAYWDQINAAKADEDTAYQRGIYADETAYSQGQDTKKWAYDLWSQMGTASPEIAAILGVPAGATTSDQAYQTWQMQYQDRGLDADIEAQNTTLTQNQDKINWAKYMDTQNLSLDQQELALKEQLQNHGIADQTRVERAYANVMSGKYTSEDLGILAAAGADVSAYEDGVSDAGGSAGKVSLQDATNQILVMFSAGDSMEEIAAYLVTAIENGLPEADANALINKFNIA